jgi:cytochrome c-type biogenesis protein
LVQTGTDPEFFRTVLSVLLIAVGVALLVDSVGNRFAVCASRWTSRFAEPKRSANSSWGVFGVGALPELVWLPCVGPTLGAAIGLASVGRDLLLAFATMAAYRLGTAGVLLATGLLSQRVLAKWRPTLTSSAGFAKKGLGATLLILGVLVVLDLDKQLEARGLGWLPEWSLLI